MAAEAFDIYRAAYAAGYRPEPLMTVDEWADAYRRLSVSASAEPGQWRTSRTPYLREPMVCLSPSSPVERVIVTKGVQLGFSEAGFNWLGFVIDQAPGPMMLVMPTEQTMRRSSQQRISPLIEDTPRLAGQISVARRSDATNATLVKAFRSGAVVVMTGANSAVGLRSMPVRYLFLDEVDGFPADAGGEGDPVDLATKRTVTFARRKILMVSTPTLAGLSRITAAYGESDQRRYFVPCPDCGHMQTLEWKRIRWPEGRPEEAAHQCEACGALATEDAKPAMLAAGEWRPGAEGDGKTAGFHISSLYSPWLTWAECAREFSKVKDQPERLKAWVNTVLGETWEERGDSPDVPALLMRRGSWRRGSVPPGVLLMTAGVDVQQDRLEHAIYGWGLGLTSWLIDVGVILGDPSADATWRQLDELLQREFDGPGAHRWRIDVLGVDAGYLSHMVYAWTARYGAGGRVFALDGRPGWFRPPVSPPVMRAVNRHGRRRGNAQLWPVGTYGMKAELYSALRLTIEGPEEDGSPRPGSAVLPDWVDAEFFEQLTAEYVRTKQKANGAVAREWAVRHGVRNEMHDCAVYARALAHQQTDSLSAAGWARLAATRAPDDEEATAAVSEYFGTEVDVTRRSAGLQLADLNR